VTIKLDVSKAVSSRSLVYLLGLFPGLLFEVSIALANPTLAERAVDRIKHIYPAPNYLIMILLIASGFVFGQAFIQLAWMADWVVGVIYRMYIFSIRRTFGSWRAYQWLGKLQQKFPKRPLLIRIYSNIVFAVRMPMRAVEAQPTLRCLETASEELLQVRYGIKGIGRISSSREEFQVWTSVIGKPLMSYMEGMLAGRTTLASGLAGLTAMWWVPDLRERYFFGLCVVFVITGCTIAINQLRWKVDPVKRNVLLLRSVLLDLSDAHNSEKTVTSK
jgi:hypothetical protein